MEDPVDSFFIPKERQEVKTILTDFQKSGYKYVVRNQDSKYLTCFSHKPQKYKEDGSFWGYRDSDMGNAKPCELITNNDVTEINFSNRSATLISTFLEKG